MLDQGIVAVKEECSDEASHKKREKHSAVENHAVELTDTGLLDPDFLLKHFVKAIVKEEHKIIIEEKRKELPKFLYKHVTDGQAKVIPEDDTVCVLKAPRSRLQGLLPSNTNEQTGFLTFTEKVLVGQERLQGTKITAGKAMDHTARAVLCIKPKETTYEEQESRNNQYRCRDLGKCAQQGNRTEKQEGKKAKKSSAGLNIFDLLCVTNRVVLWAELIEHLVGEGKAFFVDHLKGRKVRRCLKSNQKSRNFVVL
jgi:hypothetical protein